MKWTKAQSDAIRAEAATVLVAAGAGAGKTTCMTERIIQNIEDGTDITEMLVVTFTRAAAADIRSKLYEKLTQRLGENVENRRLYTQLSLIPAADISTVHSFCLRVVRDNFQLLGISPAVRVLDEAEDMVIRARCMRDTLSCAADNADEDLMLLYESIADRHSDAILAELIESVYDKVWAYPDPYGYLDECVRRYEDDALYGCGEGSGLSRTLLNCGREICCELEKKASDAAGFASCFGEEYSRPFEFRCQLAGELYEACRSFECIHAAVSVLPKLPNVKKAKLGAQDAAALDTAKDKYNSLLEELKSLFSLDSESVKRQSGLNAGFMRALRRLVVDFDGRCTAQRIEYGALNYSELEHYMLKLLLKDGEPTELCKSLRQRYRRIFIDEYQDINPLQDGIFRALSGDNVRFMVGDAKQSIYRFRNADPSIFRGYLDTLPDYDGSRDFSGGCRIFLSENFRSGRRIVDFVNAVFFAIGGADYTKNEALVYAAGGGDEHQVKLVLADDAASEAEWIANEISRLAGSAVRRDGGIMGYGDIAVLRRGVADHIQELCAALSARGIPFATANGNGYFTAPEIQLAQSVLRCIENPLDDIALAGVLRSPVFGFSAQELYELRRDSHAVTLYSSLRGAAIRRSVGRLRLVSRRRVARVRRGPHTAALVRCRGAEISDKAAAALDGLERLRRLADRLSLSALVWRIYGMTGMLGADTPAARKNLLIFYQQVRSFEKTSYRTVGAFNEYFREAAQRGKPPKGYDGGAGDCVRIMTIHSSKGLDFPAVFLCGASSGINKKDVRERMIVSRGSGISFRCFDPHTLIMTDTVRRRIAVREEQTELLREERRLLYVALTRAKERLYVCGAKKTAADSYMASLLSVPDIDKYCELIDTAAEPDVSGEISARNNVESPEICSGNGADISEIRRALDFVYPYPPAPRTKISVSELSIRGQAETVPYSVVGRRPVFVTGRDGAAVGTAMHEFMQFCSFENVIAYGARNEAARLVRERFMADRKPELLDFAKLERFFTSDIYGEIASSPEVWREKRFSVSEELEGEKIIVQGVIDLFFENREGGYTVVDYKTDRDDTAIGERHRTQLLCYCRAVAEMTGRPVTRAVVYAFSSGKTEEIPIK